MATDEQLQAIAFIAAACRPTGCKQWDAPGIFKNLAKVRDRSLASITIAAIQAAEDRNAATPGVIPTAGPHWRTPESAPIQRQSEPAGVMCATCGHSEAACRMRWAGDHQYVPVERTRGGRTDEQRERTRRMNEAVKGEIQPLGTLTKDEKKPTVANPRVGELRDIKAKATSEGSGT